MSDEYTKRYKSARAVAEVCVTILEGIDYKMFVNDINEAVQAGNNIKISHDDYIKTKALMLKDRQVFMAATKFIESFYIEYQDKDYQDQDYEELPADPYPHSDDPTYN